LIIYYSPQTPRSKRYFKKRYIIVASVFVTLVLFGVIGVLATMKFKADVGTYVNDNYGTDKTSPIKLISPEKALYELNNSSAKTVEDLGSYLQQSGLRYTWSYREPSIDNGQPHLIMGYWTANNRIPANGAVNQLFDVNLATGATTKTEADLKGLSSMIMGPNGKLYFGYGTISEYDPIAHTIKIIHTQAKSGGADMFFVPTANIGGKIVMYVGENYAAYMERGELDEATNTWTWTNLGKMDDPTLRGAKDDGQRFSFGTVSPDDRYVYMNIRDQAEGWEVVGYDRQTGQTKRYWPGSIRTGLSYAIDGKVWLDYWDNNNVVHVYNISGLPDQNQLVELTGSAANGPHPATDPTGTSAKYYNGFAQSNYFYALDDSEADADNGTNATANIKIRHCTNGNVSSCTEPWRTVTFEGITMSPAPIGRTMSYSSNELLIKGPGYGPYAVVNVVTKQLSKILGHDSMSFYDGLYDSGKWYFSGYPQTAFDQWDPSTDWVTPALGQISSSTNPKYLPIQKDLLGKYNYYTTKDDQGTIYIGIHHQRENSGGSIAWYNPADGTYGGLREPFLNYDVRDLISINGGKKLVYSSLMVAPATSPKLFVIDTATKTVEKSYDLNAMGLTNSHTGAIVEIEPGVIMGGEGGVLYRFDTNTGKMDWIVGEPSGTQFGSAPTWFRQLILGPDGYVWLFIDNNIYRVNPKDGSTQKIVSNSPDSGTLTFFNNDLYIAGYTKAKLYRVTNLFDTKGRIIEPTDTTAPTAPTALTATAKDTTSINLTWTASTDSVGVTGYKIYRDGTEVGASQGLEFTDSGLTSSTTYSYTVKAYDLASNVSEPSNTAEAKTKDTGRENPPPDTTAPDAPTKLVATAKNSETVNLSWNASSDNTGVTGYKIFRNDTQIATTIGIIYSDTGLTASTTYSYIVKAYDAADNLSQASNTATVTTPQEFIITPVSKSATGPESPYDNNNNTEQELSYNLAADNSNDISGTNSEGNQTDTNTAISEDTIINTENAPKAQKLEIKISHFWIMKKVYATISVPKNKNWHFELHQNGQKVKSFDFVISWFLSLIHNHPTTATHLWGVKYNNSSGYQVIAYDKDGSIVAYSDLFSLGK
jgi:chitodextrinase